MEHAANDEGRRGGLLENIVLFLVLLAFVLFSTGCTNMTVVKLTELCYESAGKPTSSFNGSSGKVECK